MHRRLVSGVKIQNKTLAKTLEKTCQEQFGFLTYSEYLEITQFGKHGYHETHTTHGITDTSKRWSRAVAAICQKEEIKEVIEFGSGDGQLALGTVQAAKTEGNSLSWTCIEINTLLQKQTKDRFAAAGLERQLRTASSMHAISFSKPSLCVFSYSLDSIPPEIFMNSDIKKSYPDVLIGINVSHGILSEQVLAEEVLQKKGLSLRNGIYTNAKGMRFDLRQISLHPSQRIYLPLPAMATLVQFLRKLPLGSRVLILDEFASPQASWKGNDLLLPKNLLVKKRECSNYKNTYRLAGEQLFYYQNYSMVLMKLLQLFGYYVEACDIEQQLANTLIRKSWLPLRSGYNTYALLTRGKTKREEPSLLQVQFPRRTVF